MSITENIADVRVKILAAAERAGRKADCVKILAVSKTVSEDRIMEAYNAGQKYFGENKVQEWQRKSPLLPADCEWHIIGRLQTNKIKYLNSGIALIHSLDRLPLLQKLEDEGAKRQICWNTLIQVNVAKDEAKAGLEIEEVKDFLIAVKDCSYVRVKGLMTIGALDASKEETRSFFRKLKEIRDGLIAGGDANQGELTELSMGMSQDYELAVEEGATIVRIGSTIFGQRN